MNKGRIFWISYAVLLSLFLLKLIPFAFSGVRLWGFNHLIFLPEIYTVIFIALAVVTLVLPLFSFAEAVGRFIIGRFSSTFFQSDRKYLHRLLFIAIMSCLFVIFSAPTHFLGDGYTLLSNLASETVTITKWSEKGITITLSAIQSLIGGKSEATALVTFRIISAVSGAVTIWFLFAITAITTEEGAKRLLLFLTQIFSGVVLLFFGYVENYPLVWAAFTGYIYFALRYLKTGSGLLWSFLFLAVGSFIHLLMVIFLPSFLFILSARGTGYNLYSRFRGFIFSATGILVLVCLYLFINKYNTDLYFENIFLPLLHGKPVNPDYTIFSLPHLVDILNQLILLSPLLPLFLVLSFRRRPRLFKNKVTSFLILVAISNLLFLFVIDAQITMPRDWDLFSLSALALTVLAILLIKKSDIVLLTKFTVPIAVALFLSSLPYLLTNLNEKPSLKYIQYIIDLEPQKSRIALILLNNYYDRVGDTYRFDSTVAVFNNRFYNDRMIEACFEALENNQIEQAAGMFSMIKPNRFSANYHNLHGTLLLRQGHYERALKEMNRAIQLRPYYAPVYSKRALVYSRLMHKEKALKDLRKGYRLDRYEINILEGLATVYLAAGLPDSTLLYADKLIEADSQMVVGYYLAAKALVTAKKWTEAKKYAEKYIKHGVEDPLYIRRWKRLAAMINGLSAPPDSGESHQPFRR